jgi:hypothetical protein
MVTHFSNADGSVTGIYNGYSPDFVTQLPRHLAYLRDSLGVTSDVLDLSLVSLKYVDALCTEQKRVSRPFPQALEESIIAYCGEVLRSQVGGEWFYYVVPADARSGERYFPAIQGAAGIEIDFFGIVQKELERPSGCYLSTYLPVCLSPPLPVQKWERHPSGDDMFPPLPKKPPLRRVFPSKE